MTFAITGAGRAPGILDGRSAVAPSAVSLNLAAAEFREILERHRCRLARPDFHHVPGRLRLRDDAVKHNATELEAICAKFEAAPGVRSVTPNRLTGSVIIHYDTSVLPAGALSAALPECGLATNADTPPWAEHVAAKAIGWLLEALATALIAAVV
jgi:hypothetical protein